MNRKALRMSLSAFSVLLLPTLVAPVLGQATTTEAKPEVTVDKSLPSADQILEKYIDAIGGEKAIRSHTGMTLDGTMEMPAQAMSINLNVQASAPNMMLVIFKIEGMGEGQQGYNGKVGWSIDPMMGASLLEGDMLEQAKLEAEFYGDLEYKKTYKTITVAEKTEFNGEPAYRVHLVSKAGLESDEYFHVKTGLKIGEAGEMESPMGAMKITSKLGDYKEFDGVKIATKVVIGEGPMERILTVVKVAWGPVDKSVFEMPSEIAELSKGATVKAEP